MSLDSRQVRAPTLPASSSRALSSTGGVKLMAWDLLIRKPLNHGATQPKKHQHIREHRVIERAGCLHHNGETGNLPGSSADMVPGGTPIASANAAAASSSCTNWLYSSKQRRHTCNGIGEHAAWIATGASG